MTEEAPGGPVPEPEEARVDPSPWVPPPAPDPPRERAVSPTFKRWLAIVLALSGAVLIVVLNSRGGDDHPEFGLTQVRGVVGAHGIQGSAGDCVVSAIVVDRGEEWVREADWYSDDAASWIDEYTEACGMPAAFEPVRRSCEEPIDLSKPDNLPYSCYEEYDG